MVARQSSRRDRGHALVPAGLRSRARSRGRARRRRSISTRRGSKASGRRAPDDDRGHASRPLDPRDGALSSSTPAGRGASCTARLSLGEQARRWLPPTEGLYTHFTNVERWDRLHDTDEAPPYPMDDAALHHVFPGGWIWILRFNNGITSAGAALTDPLAASLGASARASRLASAARVAAFRGRSVPRRANRAAVHPLAADRVPQRTGGGHELGAAAVGSRRHRSAALDRLPADPARHPAIAGRAGANVAPATAKRPSPTTNG